MSLDWCMYIFFSYEVVGLLQGEYGRKGWIQAQCWASSLKLPRDGLKFDRISRDQANLDPCMAVLTQQDRLLSYSTVGKYF